MNGSDTLSAEYVSAASIRRVFGISHATVRNWAEAEAGKIGAIRVGDKDGRRLYRRADVEKAFPGYRPPATNQSQARARICYARVSSAKQGADLERQIQVLRAACPAHEIVSDVGSGLNWHRKGFLAVLDRAVRGAVEEVVVAHRDRLCRLAFEHVEHVLQSAGCRVVVLDHVDDSPAGRLDAAAELCDDLLAVVTYFVGSNNGKRAAAHRRERAGRGGAKGAAADACAGAPAEAGEDGGGLSDTDGSSEQEGGSGVAPNLPVQVRGHRLGGTVRRRPAVRLRLIMGTDGQAAEWAERGKRRRCGGKTDSRQEESVSESSRDW